MQQNKRHHENVNAKQKNVNCEDNTISYYFVYSINAANYALSFPKVGQRTFWPKYKSNHNTINAIAITEILKCRASITLTKSLHLLDNGYIYIDNIYDVWCLMSPGWRCCQYTLGAFQQQQRQQQEIEKKYKRSRKYSYVMVRCVTGPLIDAQQKWKNKKNSGTKTNRTGWINKEKRWQLMSLFVSEL